VPEDWWYFPVVARLHNERTGYPTQKPEGLIQRIILASSNPGDLVADFFCGSGTFPLVAARHGRHFLACDNSWRAFQTARSRLSEQGQPFTLQKAAKTIVPSGNLSFKLNILQETIRLVDAPELDYWEVDPAWDGNCFHSAMQVRRPIRSGPIPLEIKPPAALSNLCVRAVTVSGEQIQLHV
jgi:SAM-dependent methyltransferase